MVHKREGGDGTFVLQVAVIHANLTGQQQALIDDRTRRHRRHKVFLAVLELERLDPMAGGLADHVQLPLERIGHNNVFAPANEDLPDQRLAGLHGRRMGMDASTGTSRQPSTIWPSAFTVRSSSCSHARRDAFSFGRKIMPTPYSPSGGSVTPCFAISSR